MFNNIRNYCIINDNDNNNNSKTNCQFRRIIFKIVRKENHRNNNDNNNNYHNCFNISSHFQKWEEDYFAEDYWTSKLTVIVKFHNWKP